MSRFRRREPDPQPPGPCRCGMPACRSGWPGEDPVKTDAGSAGLPAGAERPQARETVPADARPQDAWLTAPAFEGRDETVPAHDPAWWDRQPGETPAAWQERIEGQIDGTADQVAELDAQREPGALVSEDLARARAAHMWALTNGLGAAERASSRAPAAGPESAERPAASWDKPLPPGADMEAGA
jgi:hypothetical protein